MTVAEQELALAGVQGRATVDRLLPASFDAALEAARAIFHPWYRCQALSNVAAHAADTHVAQDILAEAFRAAGGHTEPNRVATASAWPLSVLVAINADAARGQVGGLVTLLASEPHTIRRADGLLAIFQAVGADEIAARMVAPALIEAIRMSRSAKTPRILAAFAVVVAVRDRPEALELLKLIPETREIRRARRLIESNQLPPARVPLPGFGGASRDVS